MQVKRKEQVVSFLTSYAPQHTFPAAGKLLRASIHGVLLGHEDWVHSVAWIPRFDPSAAAATQPAHVAGRLPAASLSGVGTAAPHHHMVRREQALQLLTASMDRTIMIWGPDKASGLWMCEESVGDAGAPPATQCILCSQPLKMATQHGFYDSSQQSVQYCDGAGFNTIMCTVGVPRLSWVILRIAASSAASRVLATSGVCV